MYGNGIWRVSGPLRAQARSCGHKLVCVDCRKIIAMIDVRHLSRAPITEAIVDFRVKANSEFQVATFADLREVLRGEFPEVAEQKLFQATFGVSKGDLLAPRETNVGLGGFIFKSSDGLDLVQFRIDGFTYNRLKPYSSWDEIFPRAIELWKLYVEKAKPLFITRLALRYINHIEISGRSFEKFMTAPPRLTEQIDLDVKGFLTRITVQDRDTEMLAHVTQALQDDITQPKLILDIDAFRKTDLEVEEEQTDLEIQRTFDALRNFKNKMFFASLKEETIRSFE